jgi:thiopeptide-type bacteriocin biosynthesis protein
MKEVTTRPSGSTLAELYRGAGFFVLRTPLLPLVGADTPPSGSPDGVTEPPASGMSRGEATRELRRQLSRAELRESLYFASPRLERKLDTWLRGAASDPRLERTLARYLGRLGSRATPFGTFAGVSLGRLGEQTRLRVAGRESYRRVLRLDMSYVLQSVASLVAQPSVREKLRYEACSTLHPAFGRWRFASVDPAAPRGAGVSRPVMDVTPSRHIDAAIAHAGPGKTLAELAAALEAPGPPHDATRAFVEALIGHGLLTPTLWPAVTGIDPAQQLVTALQEADLQPLALRLEAIRHRLVELGDTPLGAATPHLRELASELERDLYEVKPNAATCFHADLIKPGPALCLGREHTAQLLQAAEIAHHTSAAPTDHRLDRFRARFVERYGSSFVPLGEALDGELGIGFESFQHRSEDVLCADLGIGGGNPAAPPTEPTAREQLLVHLLTTALERGDRVLVLEPSTLARFPRRKLDRPPESLLILAQLARVGEHIEVVAPTLVGPSGLNLLGRFCHADTELESAVRALAAREQQLCGERLLVDVAILPDAQAANIMLRPVLRSHELVYAGRSGAEQEQRIPVSDLEVGIVEGDIVLRSRRLGRQLSIRMTSAHNVDAWWELPLYRFLGALQQAERGGVGAGWSWGQLALSPFLPRVVAAGVVLCRARWAIERTRLPATRDVLSPLELEQVAALRQRLGLPRWVVWLHDQTPLVVDLDDALALEAFLDECRGASVVVLEEMYPRPDQLCVTGPEGTFVGEVLLPVVLAAEPARQTARALPAVWARATRTFAPGSEWLYAKLYTGPSEFGRVLAQVESVVGAGPRSAAERWFFLPFADPDPHLRVRVRGEPRRLLGELLPSLHEALAPLLARGAIWRFQLDSYERELERYGGPLGTDLAEEAFWIDSEAVLALAPCCSADPELRWQLTAVGIERLLACLGLSFDQRAAFVGAAAEGLVHELGVTVEVRRQIGDRYRRHERRLGELLWGTPDGHAARGLGVIEERSRRLAPVCDRLQDTLRRGTRDIMAWPEVVSALPHLHAVRMLGHEARAQELVLYDFLHRQYVGRRARAGRGEAQARATLGGEYTR